MKFIQNFIFYLMICIFLIHENIVPSYFEIRNRCTYWNMLNINFKWSASQSIWNGTNFFNVIMIVFWYKNDSQSRQNHKFYDKSIFLNDSSNDDGLIYSFKPLCSSLKKKKVCLNIEKKYVHIILKLRFMNEWIDYFSYKFKYISVS